jgi:Ca-activated chloride channel homolog
VIGREAEAHSALDSVVGVPPTHRRSFSKAERSRGMTLRSIWLLVLAFFSASCLFGGKAQNPAPRAPAVRIDAALDGQALRAESDASAVVKLTIRPRPDDPSRHAPANVALVIDTSGSMIGKPIDDAREAARALVRSLADGDRLAVVAFGTRAEVLQPSIELDGSARSAIEEKLAAMQARGTTDLAAGLARGLEQLGEALDPDGINRVVLLGDGIPNDAAGVPGLVESSRSRGITITALGLGLDYDEALMAKIAQGSGGKFRHLEDSTKVAAFFRGEVLRLQGVVARNARLELSVGPGVRVTDVIGQTWQPNGAGATLELGDISRGDERTIYVELAAATRRAGSAVELVDAQLSWSLPGASERADASAFVASRTVAGDAAVEAGRDASVELGAALARSAAATVRALDLARGGRHGEAKALLETTAKKLDELGARLKNPKLGEEARALRALTTDLPPPSAPQRAAPRKPSDSAAPVSFGDDAVESAAPAAAMPRSAEQARRAMKQHADAIERLQ